MSRVLVVAEHANGNLSPATAKTLSCARQLGAGDLVVVVFADHTADVAAQASRLEGVTRVLSVSEPRHARTRARHLDLRRKRRLWPSPQRGEDLGGLPIVRVHGLFAEHHELRRFLFHELQEDARDRERFQRAGPLD